jgi:hypothetical protein
MSSARLHVQVEMALTDTRELADPDVDVIEWASVAWRPTGGRCREAMASSDGEFRHRKNEPSCRIAAGRTSTAPVRVGQLFAMGRL